MADGLPVPGHTQSPAMVNNIPANEFHCVNETNELLQTRIIEHLTSVAEIGNEKGLPIKVP